MKRTKPKSPSGMPKAGSFRKIQTEDVGCAARTISSLNRRSTCATPFSESVRAAHPTLAENPSSQRCEGHHYMAELMASMYLSKHFTFSPSSTLMSRVMQSANYCTITSEMHIYQVFGGSSFIRSIGERTLRDATLRAKRDLTSGSG